MGSPFATANDCKVLSYCFQIGIQVFQFVRSFCSATCRVVTWNALVNMYGVLAFETLLVL
jgi:hypothetical protein